MNSGACAKRLGCVSATKADVVDFATKHGDFFIIYGGFCLPSNMQIFIDGWRCENLGIRYDIIMEDLAVDT